MRIRRPKFAECDQKGPGASARVGDHVGQPWNEGGQYAAGIAIRSAPSENPMAKV
jgi:hypothetical protein